MNKEEINRLHKRLMDDLRASYCPVFSDDFVTQEQLERIPGFIDA